VHLKGKLLHIALSLSSLLELVTLGLRGISTFLNFNNFLHVELDHLPQLIIFMFECLNVHEIRVKFVSNIMRLLFCTVFHVLQVVLKVQRVNRMDLLVSC